MGATKLEFLSLREEETQNEETGLSFEIKSLLHADKASIGELSRHLVDRVATGEVDVYKAYIHAKKVNELSSTLEKNLRPYVNSKGIPKAGLTMYNLVFTSKSDPDSYDFSVCGDKVWDTLQEKLKEVKADIKNREAFLKTIKKEKTEIDEETGEFYTIQPPQVTSGAENFSASIK